jgi:hypothetical protein
VPSINKPEISKGFWITVGVIIALFLLSLATALYARTRGSRKG